MRLEVVMTDEQVRELLVAELEAVTPEGLGPLEGRPPEVETAGLSRADVLRRIAELEARRAWLKGRVAVLQWQREVMKGVVEALLPRLDLEQRDALESEYRQVCGRLHS